MMTLGTLQPVWARADKYLILQNLCRVAPARRTCVAHDFTTVARRVSPRTRASSSFTQTDGPTDTTVKFQADQPEQDQQTVRSNPQADVQTSWGEAPAQDDEWLGSKPLTLKDIDWGLAGLLGVILLLSFGAYRVLDHFRVYQHSRRPPTPQTTVVERQPAATSSSRSKPSRSKSKQDKASKSSSNADRAAATASAAAAVPEAVAVAGGDASLLGGAVEGSSQQAANAAGDVAEAANASFDIGSSAPSLDLPQAGTPGAPQPSPLDAEFSSSMPRGPWAGSGLGQLDFAPLPPLQEGLPEPPELPTIHVDPPAKAVTPAEIASMPSDPSLPSLRERAHIAMRASGAAMEASQRAAAYSAAASSAASRAAEAAEQAAVSASAVQSALEAAAEDAMAEAVKRMNRAVEMVADAESRAAAAAAMATAYQDISDTQAAAATAAADLPERPKQQQQQGHIANLRQRLHEQMFSARELLTDWVASIWAAIVGFVTFVKVSALSAWHGAVQTVSGVVNKVKGA